MSEQAKLPRYTAADFAKPDLVDCDMIMKGGITSGVVYPYAVLEIATRHRLRSLGGTSAGAIAAAFAAAAEYARRGGDPGGYVRLQERCDQLPELLPDLFQPNAALAPAVAAVREVAGLGQGRSAIASFLWRHAGPGALLAGAVAAGAAWLLHAGTATMILAVLLAMLLAAVWLLVRHLRANLAAPLRQAMDDAEELGFGLCPGPTQPGAAHPGLTDWLHDSMQYIAFGAADHARPLTFGDLEGDGTLPSIALRMVTTNLSMRRPHTLPRLGIAAGFDPDRWARLFPASVMTYLSSTCKAWKVASGKLLFPAEADLPVIVAVRMSLSFPVLFTTVELHMEDYELPGVLKSLGAKPYRRVRKVHFSDGGLTSNFPVHLFDQPLPSRPTFAFSLDDLDWDPAEVKRRVALPDQAGQGTGVRIKKIEDLTTFGWQVLASAKDWQDQLTSQLAGQRERVVHIYLDPKEGGLNLTMPARRSRGLMRYGLEAGQAFNTRFNFDEHRWRRMIVLYKAMGQQLDALDKNWVAFSAWYDGYRTHVGSYKAISATDRRNMAANLDAILAAWGKGERINTAARTFPRTPARVRVTPEY